MLKDGETLASYGIENGSVLHFVERPVGVMNELPNSAANNSTPAANEIPTLSNMLATGRGGVLFHSMELDPTANPAALAAQITSSLMGAISGVFGPDTADSTESSPAAAASTTRAEALPANTAPAAAPAGRSARTATARSATNFVPFSTSEAAAAAAAALSHQTRRMMSRPSAARSSRLPSSSGLQQSPPPYQQPPTTLGHSLVRTEARAAVANLTHDLSRLSTHEDGSPLFATLGGADGGQRHRPSSPAALLQLTPPELLQTSLEAFERVYWMLASGCREIREGVAAGQVPWDRLHNLLAMLQELPSLMIVQRRLLASIRSGRGTVELPGYLDVPEFLERPIQDDPRTPPSNIIEPPE